MNREEAYRKFAGHLHLVSFNVIVKETDVTIQARKNLSETARQSILRHRGYIEAFIRDNPSFAATRAPFPEALAAPRIVRDMIEAGRLTGVGPMAAVAGAVAQQVGRDLLHLSNEVVVENGGDVFLKLDEPVTVGIYAGKSPLSMKVGIRLNATARPLAVCTSSGTIGHSFSYGRSDAVVIVSRSCALADAAATAIGNRIQSKSDVRPAVQTAEKIHGVIGAVAIIDDTIGIWGDLSIIPLTQNGSRGKKG